MVKSVLVGILLFVLSQAQVVFAAGEVAKVTKLVGVAILQRDNQDLGVKEGIDILAGDRITTESNSIAELLFSDGSVVTIGKASQFSINRFDLYQDRPHIALFELAKGAFRSITGSITKRPHLYEVKTPTAIIGVRGTDFWGGYGLTENGFDVVMLEGTGVYVRNYAGDQVELPQAGLGTTVINTNAPTPPKKWSDAKVAKAVATITP